MLSERPPAFGGKRVHRIPAKHPTIAKDCFEGLEFLFGTLFFAQAKRKYTQPYIDLRN
jgi:hypothetical protein